MTRAVPIVWWSALLALCGAVAYSKYAHAEPEMLSSTLTSNPALAPIEDVGVAIDEQGLYVQSWGRWMEFAPVAFERAIRDGEVGPDNVLAHVLQRALPRHVWPPPPESQYAEQYQDLVKVVAKWLTIGPEPESPRLTVVK